MKQEAERKRNKGEEGWKQDVDTYRIQKILHQATETHAVPKHGIIWIDIIFYIITAQTTANRTHCSN